MTESRILTLLVDSFWDILLPGLTVTIPLTVISAKGLDRCDTTPRRRQVAASQRRVRHHRAGTA